MHIRFISPNLHSVADYGAGVGLIIFPFILNIGNSHPLAKHIAIAMGIVLLLCSLMTDYKLSLFKIISFKTHLFLDLTVAAICAGLPFVLNFSGLDAYYYWFNALAVIVVVGFTNPALEAV